MQSICTIEHHAVLYALLARAVLKKGRQGRQYLEAFTEQYGTERGKRMAACAALESVEASALTYPIFKEWRGEPGQMQTGMEENTSRFVTYVSRCQWVESWKKYGLLEFGKPYCRLIDKALYSAYQPEAKLEVCSLLSAGDEQCRFDWGYERDADSARRVKELQERVGIKYVRDFDFHTSDLYRVACQVFGACMGAEGETVCKNALKEFGDIFGEDAKRRVLEAAER
ncbi:MAG: L-2-amino-thiazoline-4-carboxylic acid hydrolase [Lachnospiraceae bacterium]|nr:L-2-amino-thiazoline-4-carboxylic acid hydrolase [Lachnospiraceae bacterium]